MWRAIIIFCLLMIGCVGVSSNSPMTIVMPTRDDLYSVATIQKITDPNAPVHIYIEGDGYAFNAYGYPTNNPTPHTKFMRNMAAADNASNVAYIARPCQFVMDTKCHMVDWTGGRFSRAMIDSVASAIKKIAGTRPVILVGYSGGAMISGLVIQNHSDIDAIQWITIAGVLNHQDWTEHFGDSPLKHSLNIDTLPRVSQVHYVAENDKTVPYDLSKKWIGDKKMVIIPGADHNSIPVIKLDFIK